jgi:hypothetical protein
VASRPVARRAAATNVAVFMVIEVTTVNGGQRRMKGSREEEGSRARATGSGNDK